MIAKSPELPIESQSVRHVDDYLEVGQKAGASDVHLAVKAQPRWRLHGRLEPIWPDAPLLTAEQTAALAEAFMPNVYKNELNTRGDSAFAY
jgi:Tfp pilus assembly pilus retraction ATPase PilT